MKRKTVMRRTLCLLLMLVLAVSCLPAGAFAREYWSQDRILEFFAPGGERTHDLLGFTLTGDQLATAVQEALQEQGLEYDVVYDDEESTAKEKYYILMLAEGWNNGGNYFPIYLRMTADAGTGRIQSLRIHLGLAEWAKKDPADAAQAFAEVYARLKGSMTDAEREVFLTGRNLRQTEDGFTAEGTMDGLFYRLDFTDDYLCMWIIPGKYANAAPIAEYYREGSVLYEDPAFLIRTGTLTRNPYSGYLLELELVNRGKHPLRFHMTHAMIDNGEDLPMSVYEEVSPGKTKTVQLFLDEAIPAAAGLQTLYELSPWFTVTDLTTDEILYDYRQPIPLGIPLYGDICKNSTVLYKDANMELHVLGSAVDPATGRPELYLRLVNNCYPGEMLVRSESSCIVGDREYDLFVSGTASGFSSGIFAVAPMAEMTGDTITMKFDISIRSHNLNQMVAGTLTVRMNEAGKLQRITDDLKKTSQYDQILQSDYNR